MVNLQEISPEQRESEALRLANEEALRPFDLNCGPLLRATLLQLGEQEYVVLVTLHQIVFDGWSEGVLLRELAALYEAFSTGKPSPLPELPIQYADFAIWQRRSLQGEFLDALLSYWKQQLGDGLKWGEDPQRWSELATGGLTVHPFPAEHRAMMREPFISVLSEQLRTYLDEAQSNDGNAIFTAFGKQVGETLK